jgi:hypothetical protein
MGVSPKDDIPQVGDTQRIISTKTRPPLVAARSCVGCSILSLVARAANVLDLVPSSTVPR